MKYSTHSKQGYPIIYEDPSGKIFFREGCPELRYVMGTGYDAETGEWDHGYYTTL